MIPANHGGFISSIPPLLFFFYFSSPQGNLLHYSNGKNNENVITEIDSEVFALSNSSMDSPFQKVIKGKQIFNDICSKYKTIKDKDKLISELLTFLKWDEKHYPDTVIDSFSHIPEKIKPNYSAIFVKIPTSYYGTR